ncbi:protein-glutamate methylesterase/protein-glutamine glutaminase [Jeotgalibacillus soli]|uniref:Protein-glutamate methylesterase/protein-glutamine glutaminase n=1 Tax=Jeotgalibacillus soli TaxID=889306 RepID=A0A0C2VKB5_9BACL|nr:chemotaxis response regulator protein-glutamate methylesterase [Jeotgalibacillus soli]KIL44906.1 chemotaxis protein CheY [Jeotgalibacillus soli]
MAGEQIIKVLVVDDSAFMRKLIGDYLSEDKQIVVVGTARNGQDAIAKIKLLRPHVVTMDVEMPVMNGIEALKTIMEQDPLPVIMLSSTTKKGADNTLTAMEHGAIDFVTKPSGTISLDLHKVKEELVVKVKNAAKVHINKIINPTARIKYFSHDHRVNKTLGQNNQQTINKPVPPRIRHQKLVLIGTSTGGPRALQEVITSLPKTITAPVLVVQHMPAGFTKSLANRLNSLSAVIVKEAEHGDVLTAGTVYIAPGGFHLIVDRVGEQLIAQLTKESARGGHRPSVDVLFESVAKLTEIEKIAVIMTGMGADGSKGLVKLNHNPPLQIIAESQQTCIVYGMPKAAIATGLVQDVEDLQDIAKTIMKYLP